MQRFLFGIVFLALGSSVFALDPKDCPAQVQQIHRGFALSLEYTATNVIHPADKWKANQNLTILPTIAQDDCEKSEEFIFSPNFELRTPNGMMKGTTTCDGVPVPEFFWSEWVTSFNDVDMYDWSISTNISDAHCSPFEIQIANDEAIDLMKDLGLNRFQPTQKAATTLLSTKSPSVWVDVDPSVTNAVDNVIGTGWRGGHKYEVHTDSFSLDFAK